MDPLARSHIIEYFYRLTRIPPVDNRTPIRFQDGLQTARRAVSTRKACRPQPLPKPIIRPFL